MPNVVLETNLPGLPDPERGKVRDRYDLKDGRIVFISTDRISSDDVVLPNGIPWKGHVLNRMSEHWFNLLESIVPHHMITTNIAQYPEILRPHAELLEGRSMLVQKANPLPVECVVRAYLYGSGWREYKQHGTMCGEKLPEDLREADRLPELTFTPATKAERGLHDENISVDRMQEILGNNERLTDKIIQTSFALFEAASAHAEKVGIILCDTKFEFGWIDGKLVLIDEVFTPDSSRFWPRDRYQVGGSQPSFDKQYVRDHLSGVGWNKQPPAPELPAEVIHKTSEKYLEAYRLIVDSPLPGTEGADNRFVDG